MTAQPASRRTGFTLIELMVGMAVIAILVSLLLPAIQQAREAARQLSCRNNLRQIGLALQNYQTAHGVLPPSELSALGYSGSVGRCQELEDTPVEDHPSACTEYQSWTALTLPFYDQAGLSHQLDFNMPWSNLKNRAGISTWLPIFTCPSAVASVPDPHHVRGAAPTNYAAVNEVEKLVFTDTFGVPNPGSSARLGVLAEHRANRLRDIADGMSNTILLAECAGRPAVFVGRRMMNAELFAAYTGDDVVEHSGEYMMEDGMGWADPDANIEIKGVRDDGVTLFGPRFINAINAGEIYSFHNGGANFTFADGSVRFLSEQLDGWSLISLCTRAGGEVVQDF